MERYEVGNERVELRRAWTPGEVREAVREVVSAAGLPSDRALRVVIKPNLNNDLHALTGNSTDLRVICALIEALLDDGRRDLVVADGPNVGVERRGIDVFRRLRVANLVNRYPVRIVDLNRDEGVYVDLPDGRLRVARTWMDAQVRVSVPTLKTHAEMGLSCAMKNHVGTVVAQDKRVVHRDLARNIAALWAVAPPHLVLVDALVGMQGNGPGDGEPVRLGALFSGRSPPAVDRVAAAAVGFDAARVPYLARFPAVEEPRVSRLGVFEPAPARSRLAVASERRELRWLKRLVRPLVALPVVAEAAYRANIVQDVYTLEDGGVTGVRRTSDDCGGCTACADVCPTGLPVAQIGRTVDPAACLSCLACWWACPTGAVALDGGPLGFLERHATRYKASVERATRTST